MKASKLIGLNLPYFAKNGSWVALRFFVMTLGGWLVSLTFARLGSRETLGQYQLILSIVSIFVVFSLPGLNSAALESVVKGREGGIIKAVKLSFLFSLFSSVLLIGWGAYNVLAKGEILLGETLILAGVLSPFYYAFNTWTVYYDGRSLFKKVSIRMIIINIFLTGLLIFGITYGLSFFGLVAIFLLVNAVFFVLFYIEVFRQIRNKADDYIDIKFGVKTSIQKLVLGLSGNIPPIIIAYLFSIEAVAIYYIANYLMSAASAFMGTLSALYIPSLFKNLKLNHKNIIFQNIFIGILLWIAFLIFLKLFFVLLYGDGYQKSLDLAYRISFLMILIPLKNYLIVFFMTRKKNWFLISTVGLANLTSVLFLFFIRDRYYLTGISYYIYIIELVTVIPMAVKYFKISFNNKLELIKN